MFLHQLRRQCGSSNLVTVRLCDLVTRPRNSPNKFRSQRGQSLVEFCLVCLVFFVVVFGIIEMERMLLVYTTVANAARAGVRYAIVHGHDRTGIGVNGPSTNSSYTNVVNTTKTVAGASALDASKLVVTVSYLDATNTPGSRVSVRAVYPYAPFFALPLSVNLSSVSEGVITF